MRAAIAVDDGDAHLGHDLGEAEIEGVQEIGFSLLRVDAAGGFEREPGTDGSRTHAEQNGGVVKVAAVTGLDGESDEGANAGANEGVMDGSQGEGHGDGNVLVCIRGNAVSEQQNGGSSADEVDGLGAEIIESRGQIAGRVEDAFEHGKRQVAGKAVPAGVEILHLGEREKRRRQREAGERRALVEQMGPRAEASVQLYDAGFANGVRGRIGDLRESLPEEGVDGPGRTGERGKRRVVAHRPHGVFAFRGHGLEDHVHVFAGVSEGELQTLELGGFEQRPGDVIDERAFFEKLFVIGRGGVEDGLDFFVFEEYVVVKVGDDHLSRTEAAAVDDRFRIEVDEARFRPENDKLVFG